MTCTSTLPSMIWSWILIWKAWLARTFLPPLLVMFPGCVFWAVWFELRFPAVCVLLLCSHARKPLSKFITPEVAHLAKPEALDFLDKLLR